jgi:uncharacterized protein (TIGR02147 family)
MGDKSISLKCCMNLQHIVSTNQISVAYQSDNLFSAFVHGVTRFMLSRGMENATPFYVQMLKEKLSSRQKENPQYSLRAFARDIGVNPGTLVKVFKGERPLPLNVTKIALNNLKLNPVDQTLFMESLLRTRTSLDSIKINLQTSPFVFDASNFQMITEWEHLAVIALFNLHFFEFTTEDVARHFSIPLRRAEDVVQNLLTCGLLEKSSDGKLHRVHAEVKTSEIDNGEIWKKSHIEILNLGIQKIEDVDVGFRDFSSMAVAIDMDQLADAKTIISEFRQKMSSLLNNGSNKTEVFQLAIQFYPLTKPK